MAPPHYTAARGCCNILMRTIAALLACSLSLAAVERRDLPRHLIGASEPLTPPSAAPPRAIARDFTRNLALSHGLAASDLEGLYVSKEYRTAHNGVTHLVFRQQFHGLDVYNAEWTVNVDRDGRVLNAGGALAQQPAA
ncbi:MAG: hypothetical protein FJW34_26150, partial [Acidobacteria bacterium]|nr:hypothetical protein [Acidobacteriota bacterium]